MAEERVTNLRQAEAKVFVEGIVSEKDLKVVEEEGKKSIKGHLTVKTSDVNFVRFEVNVAEKTKAGTDNKAYPGIVTVMNEYKTIADVGEEEADKVRVTGDINIYRNRNSGAEVVSYKSNFFNRLKNVNEYNPKAEFSVEMFITGIVPEIDKGEETGRIVVNGWVPTYNGIEPIKLVSEDDVASAIDSMFEPGQTVEFYGDVVNNRIETVVEIPVAIGKPRKKTTVEYKNDLLVTGASDPYEEGISTKAPYEQSAIQAAVQERQNRIEEEKAKAQSSTKTTANAKPSGASHGRVMNF